MGFKGSLLAPKAVYIYRCNALGPIMTYDLDDQTVVQAQEALH